MTIEPMAIAAAASVPLIAVIFAPRRWLNHSMALVLVSPAIVYVAIVAWEMLTGPPEAKALELAFAGFGLVSAFLAIPWLVICLIGFGIGLGVRRLLRGRSDRTAPNPRQPSTLNSLVPAPVLVAEITARSASGHAGKDPMDIEHWRDSSTHRRRQISPDGSIRVDIDSKEWGNSHWVDSPRIIEVATGRVVLDLWETDWDAAMSFPGDQQVRIHFRRYHAGGALSVELNLARDTYQILHEPGHEGPLPAAPLRGVMDGLEASSLRARRRQ